MQVDVATVATDALGSVGAASSFALIEEAPEATKKPSR
jgi:hypothetical protein